MTRSKTIILVILFIIVSNHYTQTPKEIYQKMINTVIMGLDEQGMVLAAEILSEEKYKTERENTLYFISKYFYAKILNYSPNNKDVERAYFYLTKFQKEYPESIFISDVKYAINIIEENYSTHYALLKLDDYFRSEVFQVVSKLQFANSLVTLNHPNPLSFFAENEYEGKAGTVVMKYFDDIITNHPDFEVLGYYYRIITKLARFRSGILDDGLLDVQSKEDNYYDWKDTDLETTEEKNSLLQDLTYLNSNHPSNPLTLDLNLVIANLYLDSVGGWDEELKARLELEASNHLQHILEYDKNKLGYRFLLVKEFLLNNNLGN